MVTVDRRRTQVQDLDTHYYVAGQGPPLVLLHGDGDSAACWQWVMPGLVATHRVYAPDLPGFGDSAKPPADYSPAFFERFTAAFLDALELDSVVVVGSSLGGLAALRLALARPERVAALGLVGSAGLGRTISPATRALALPGAGEAAITWARTPLGAVQRAWWRASLLFARPWRAPRAWIAEQVRLAQLPGFLEATLTALRAALDPGGQREVLLDRLPGLSMPTLVVWGTRDLVVPYAQAKAAATRLGRGRLFSIPLCGHLPHVEAPRQFVAGLSEFLAECDLVSAPVGMPSPSGSSVSEGHRWR